MSGTRQRLTRAVHALQIYFVAAVAIGPMIVAAVAQSISSHPRTTLYASVGEELITFTVDVEHATVTRQASTPMPGFVQEAWASPSAPYIYVAWSNGGSSYAGSGVTPRGDQHGISAFRTDAAGALHPEGTVAPLRSRPIHITGDARSRHLLVAYNDPSGLSVHTIKPDGTIGEEMQAGRFDRRRYLRASGACAADQRRGRARDARERTDGDDA
jgi:hypothetical protein